MAGRILIAETTAASRIILKAKIEAARYDIVQAADCEALVERAHQARPDMVILDSGLQGTGGIGSTGSTGLDSCRALKADPATRAIPVIVTDPLPSRPARLAALAAGADDYLGKPFDEVTLLALVRHLMRARVAHAELTRRQDTAEEMGLPRVALARPPVPRLAVIAADAPTGLAWRRALLERLPAQAVVVDRNGALDRWAPGDAPDGFILGADLAHARDGLMLLSELRARPATRHAVIVVNDSAADTAKAHTALDMGADAVAPGPFDAEEIALRLGPLLARKFEVDALRESADARLSLAVRDPLTGLFNRRYAETYMRRLRAQSRQTGQPFALMLLDLDRFKTVNDRFGHAVGDAVLVETANRLRANLREVDLLVRHGGEEFLVAMPATDARGAARAAERLRQVIGDRPMQAAPGDEPVPVTVSIGVTLCAGAAQASAPGGDRTEDGAPTGDSLPGLLDAADRALYRSKSDGRNLVRFADGAAA